MKVLAYVPARLGSTRLPKKALLPLNGKPLVLWILDTLRSYMEQDEDLRVADIDFMVNTESAEIATVVANAGHAVFIRDPSLAQDSTTTEEILADFLANYDDGAYDYVAIINPTSPCLSAKTLHNFFLAMRDTGVETLWSTSVIRKHVLMNGRPINYSPFGPHPRTQDVTPVEVLNWAIVAWDYTLAKQRIRQRGDCLYLGRVGTFPISERDAVDIDTQWDFDEASRLLANP